MRSILHIDMNNFYASVECLYRPEIRNFPVAVAGDPLNRHGIILAKNMLAKKLGVTTGEAIWEAKLKAPDLVLVPPDYKKYLRFSRMAREIYYEYSDQVEAFGLDENWIDLTGSLQYLRSDPVSIANTIRRRVKEELGVTVSVGVSFNKIFAKLGSDLKKPDATTVIAYENFRDIVWPLPVGELLYVGRAMAKRLELIAVNTIGDLARTDVSILKRKLGKWGEILWLFANGQDTSPVRRISESEQIKSIGNGTTCPRDLTTEQDVRLVFTVLAESVAARLRDCCMKCRGVQIFLRDSSLFTISRQKKMELPCCTSAPILETAMELLRLHYRWHKPLRSVSLSAIYLVTANKHTQLSLFDDTAERLLVQEQIEKTVDELRYRFGHNAVLRASALLDPKLTGFNPKEDHTIHPYSYFR
jgi:DNA polymerase-4